jgi:hypothetical protein
VHAYAPTSGPVFVYEPEGQLVHAGTLDSLEKRPAVQGVHVTAPLSLAASVIDPGSHSRHASRFEAGEK